MNHESTNGKQDHFHSISWQHEQKMIPKQQKEKQKRTTTESLITLPDTLLVAIGTFVPTRDFVRFSMASKRLKQLLMDSEAVVAEIIRMRIDTLQSFSLPSHSSSPIVVRNFEQLVFCEDLCFNGHNLLDGNQIALPDCYTADLDRILNAFSVLKTRPSDRLVVNAHCGLGFDDVITYLCASVFVDGALERISIITQLPKENCKVIDWGQRVSREVAKSQHPYREMARKPEILLEIFFERMFEGGFRIQMPPIPDYYKPFLGRESFFWP